MNKQNYPFEIVEVADYPGTYYIVYSYQDCEFWELSSLEDVFEVKKDEIINYCSIYDVIVDNFRGTKFLRFPSQENAKKALESYFESLYLMQVLANSEYVE